MTMIFKVFIKEGWVLSVFEISKKENKDLKAIIKGHQISFQKPEVLFFNELDML